MKKNILFQRLILSVVILTLISLLLVSCSIGIETSPEFKEVKKTAFLSVYINNRFYDKSTYKEDIGLEVLNFFGQEIKKENTQIPKALVDYFITEFFIRAEKTLLKERVMEVVPLSEYVNNEGYQSSVKAGGEIFDAFQFDDTFKIEEFYFSTSQELKLIPLNKLIRSVKKEGEIDGLISDSISFADVGNFSLSLGMDGMLIAELDASYEKLDYLSGSKIKPLVNIRIILINTAGKQVLAIGEERKNERKHYSGQVVEAKINDEQKIDFNINTDEVRIGYEAAINEGLSDVFSSLN